jgi:predicted ArsR family transcriptional regulator
MIPTLLEQVLAARVIPSVDAAAASAAREAKIRDALSAIHTIGRVSAMQVANELNCSDKTAREVLQELEKRGQVTSHKSSRWQPRLWRLAA